MLDGIKNYLSMESTGALIVTGEWGCGKTFHIEKVIMPALLCKNLRLYMDIVGYQLFVGDAVEKWSVFL